MGSDFKKKNQLMQVALVEFAEKGFQNASLNKILVETKMSKGVFYHYYENKEALYIELTGILLEKKKKFISENFMDSDMAGDIFHILNKSMTLSFEFARKNPEMAKFSSQLLVERGSDIYKKVMDTYNVNTDDFVSNLIKTGIKNGNIRADFSYDFVFNIISMLLNHVNEILDTQSHEDYDAKISELLSFLEKGLRANE